MSDPGMCSGISSYPEVATPVIAQCNARMRPHYFIGPKAC
jgi:hypothetical protein